MITKINGWYLLVYNEYKQSPCNPVTQAMQLLTCLVGNCKNIQNNNNLTHNNNTKLPD